MTTIANVYIMSCMRCRGVYVTREEKRMNESGEFIIKALIAYEYLTTSVFPFPTNSLQCNLHSSIPLFLVGDVKWMTHR